jgi:integrase/recombinase XerD
MAKLTVVPEGNDGPMAVLVDDYLTACKARGLSPNTLKNSYGYPLRKVLLPFCEREGITDAAGLTSRALDRLAGHLMDEGGERGALSRHSVHAYIRAINHFLAWAKKEGEPVQAKAQLPRLPKAVLEVLTREEIQAMEDKATSERDKLIVRTLADTGVRVGELVRLRTSDLVSQGRQHYLQVAGRSQGGGAKGDRSRLVPIPRLYPRLRRYADRGRPKDVTSDRLFISLKRRPESAGGAYEPLTESGVQQLIRNLAATVGIRRRVYPHLLRHSYITWAIRRGMHPVQIRQIVGHESTAMIDRVYSHLVPQDAYAATIKMLSDDEDQ